MDLSSWPAGMRVIVRKERPHPGAQLRFGDVNGMRIAAFATNTTRGQLPDLGLRHRRRARCEDRIRIAKDTGLANLPLHSFAANQIWCAVVALAAEITAWMQMLAFAGTDPGSQADAARRWEPKRRTAEGMTKLEIMRCLKRYIAREAYHALISDLTTSQRLDAV